MAGLISKDEIIKLSEMKQDEVNISAAQMLVLANSIVSGKEDMESIIASLEKQAWYKRMWNSFNGKMKGTAEEFAQNNGKLALYCVQAVSILVDNENFSTDMMLNIRQKLVNIYYFSTVQGIELLVGKEIVTEIRNCVSALINKVNSVTKQLDVLTILEADFETGKLDYDNHITTICGAVSKLDNDILNDNSKLDIVRNYVNDSRIIDAPERSIEAFMNDIINVPAEMTGEVYLELATMSDNIWAEMFAELMESYNMLPKMERMAKKKDVIIKAILEKKDIDESAEFTSEDLFDSLLATRIEMAAMMGNVCIKNDTVNGKCIEENEGVILSDDLDDLDCVAFEVDVDTNNRGISLNKDVYDNNTEPDYDPSTLKFTRGIPKSKKYKRLIVPINDYAFMNGEFTEYPSKTGRSITKIIRDNLRYVDDGDIITSGEHVVIPGSSSMVASGLIAIPDTPDLPMHSSWDAGVIRMQVYMPNDKYHQFMMGKEELMITHSFFDNDVDLSDPDIIEECNIASAVTFTLDELKTLMSDNDIIFEASMNINTAQSQYNHALPVGLAPDGNIVMISALEIKG